MADVFEAYLIGENGFERRFAIKRPLASSSDQDLMRFTDEAVILSLLNHPNIVTVYELAAHDGWPFQVMEYIDGLDLSELCRRTRMKDIETPPGVALEIIATVAEALHYAHGACGPSGAPLGVVHRDISPQNILISRRGHVKLTDFGIAFAHQRLEHTQDGLVRGKLSFMSPEQLKGESVSPKSDLFSLGCVLHFVMSGSSPLLTWASRASLANGESPPMSDALPGDIAEIVRQATEAKPEDRFASGAAMASACRAAMQNRKAIDLDRWLEAILGPQQSANPFVELFQLDVSVEVERRQREESSLQTSEGELALGSPTASASLTASASPNAAEDASGNAAHGQLSVGRFKLTKLVQSAGLGELFSAQAAADGASTTALVKTIPREALQSPELLALFFSEATMLAGLENPHLVRILDFGVWTTCLFLAFEHPSGTTVRKLLERAEREGRNLNAKEIAAIGLGIVRALEAARAPTARALGGVRRVVSSETVLITEDGRPQLFDFVLMGSAEHQVLSATPEPPEIRGLGLCLFELATGIEPEANLTPEDASAALTDLDPSLRHLILESLSSTDQEPWRDFAATFDQMTNGHAPDDILRELLQELDVIERDERCPTGHHAAPGPVIRSDTLLRPDTVSPSATVTPSDTVIPEALSERPAVIHRPTELCVEVVRPAWISRRREYSELLKAPSSARSGMFMVAAFFGLIVGSVLSDGLGVFAMLKSFMRIFQ